MTSHADLISEDEVLATVRETAELTGWKVYKTWISIHSPAGYPDLTLANPRRHLVLFVECKGSRGRVTQAQQDWMETLNQCGPSVKAVICWPKDLDSTLELLTNGWKI